MRNIIGVIERLFYSSKSSAFKTDKIQPMKNQHEFEASLPVFDLDRFVTAQDSCYDTVITELKVGYKRSHWMWFIFPQIAGLGTSATARHYAITSMVEAKAFLSHPMLGCRLLECVALLLQINGKTAYQILSTPDDMKLQSCLSLFSLASPEEPSFKEALAKYYEGDMDVRTIQLLNNPNS
jgi:uncharacterized protein (DUF1810 family)